MSKARDIALSKTFVSTAGIIRKILSADSRKVNKKQFENSVRNLKKYFRASITPNPQDFYNRFYLEFCHKYLLENLISNYSLVCYLHGLGLLKNSRKIIDVGTGPGTFALAYLLWLHEEEINVDTKIRIYLIDAVQEFLNIFKKIWDHIDLNKKKLIEIKQISWFIDGRMPSDINTPDLVIFSNSLSEILRNPNVNKDEFIKNIEKWSPNIAILDYNYPPYCRLIETFTEKIKACYENISLNNYLDIQGFIEFVNLGRISEKSKTEFGDFLKPNGNIQFIRSIWKPISQDYNKSTNFQKDLVNKYKKAWENHDIEILNQLFTEDATYIEKKGKSPLKGLEEIRNYWRINSRTQDSVTFTPLNISGTDNDIKVKWKCNFYRKDIHEWMKLEGVFKAKTHNGKICYFIEEFNNSTKLPS